MLPRIVLPRIRTEAVGHRVDVSLNEALSCVTAIDPSAPVDGLAACRRFADVAYLIELAATDPLGWRYVGALGVDRLNGASSSDTVFVGDHVDQSFARDVLVPSYLEVVEADLPVAHHIAAISNDTFLAYRRLSVPLHASRRSRQTTHLAVLAFLEAAMPNARLSEGWVERLTPRERQCLSLAAGGLRQQQMANAMGISEKMVELHLAHARRKLGSKTTSQAIATVLATAWARSVNT